MLTSTLESFPSSRTLKRANPAGVSKSTNIFLIPLHDYTYKQTNASSVMFSAGLIIQEEDPCSEKVKEAWQRGVKPENGLYLGMKR